MTKVTKRERILGGLWGSLVGDALGVPVEIRDRLSIQADPVIGMRGFGTHNQPPGTWSDDSSFLLCTVDSLAGGDFDSVDIAAKFERCYSEGLWTPYGKLFDIGSTTANAIRMMKSGTLPELAGGDGELSNGNGSLMRILPVCLRFHNKPSEVLLNYLHRASSLTHRHPRSLMACGFYGLIIRRILADDIGSDAYSNGLSEFKEFYGWGSRTLSEFNQFESLLTGDLYYRFEKEISSGGYVVDTLVASLWCLLTTSSFEEGVLKAVNLGGDTDTTGCVAGGLAGTYYGFKSIPQKWIRSLARHDEVELLFLKLTDLSNGPS